MFSLVPHASELNAEMTRLVYDGQEVRLADSLPIYECPFRTGTNLLVLPDLCTFALGNLFHRIHPNN